MKKISAAILGIALTLGLLVVAPSAEAATTAKKCTVTYYPNGGTGTTAPTTFTCGKSVKLKAASTFKKTYHKFTGWLHQPAGKTYDAAATVTLSASAKLYAKWARIIYTVDYDLAGGKDTSKVAAKKIPTSVTAGAGLKYTISATAPTRAHFKFKGWKLSSDNKIYAAGATTSTITKKVTLTAQWERTEYAVTFDGNGNTGGTVPPAMWVKPGAKFTIPAEKTITRQGKVWSGENWWLKGWNTKANGTGTTYKLGGTYTMGKSDIKLYAIWWLESTTPTPIIVKPYETVAVGDTLSVNRGTWTIQNTATGNNVTVKKFSYQWFLNDVAVSGAAGTGSTFKVTAAHVGKTIRVKVTNQDGPQSGGKLRQITKQSALTPAVIKREITVSLGEISVATSGKATLKGAATCPSTCDAKISVEWEHWFGGPWRPLGHLSPMTPNAAKTTTTLNSVATFDPGVLTRNGIAWVQYRATVTVTSENKYGYPTVKKIYTSKKCYPVDSTTLSCP
jgi:hypothetical protein